MKNTKVGVVEIDSSESILKGKTIPDIIQFHSVEFFDDGMRFWQYFDVGEGMFYPYTNVLFKSGVEISLHYVWASKDRPRSTSLYQKKGGLKFMPNTLFRTSLF